MKTFIGSCIDNPFDTTEQLEHITDYATEIDRSEFFLHCAIESPLLLDDMSIYPNDYQYFRYETIFFFIHSRCEHFYN